MDDRRFDAIAKSLAGGKSRRSVLKGILGLGGAALAGSVILDGDSEAARRSTNPTPTPVRCPGDQTPVGGQCQCLVPPALGPNKCGPDCCTGLTTDDHPAPPDHSECCDNACCFGTCYGEELCCPTNYRSTGEPPIPPTNRVCDTVNGPVCCAFTDECCIVDGCCETVCFGGSVGADFCCPEEQFCPGGNDQCCTGNSTCCGRDTDTNACVDLTVDGNCCTDADCGSRPCVTCHLDTHTCGPLCDPATQVCCTEQAGPGVCVDGECCLGAPCRIPPEGTGLCCLTPLGTQCLDVEVCPGDCDCPEGTTCCRDVAGAIICVLGDSCDCDEFCGPIATRANNGDFYCCTEPDYTICCDGPESECCGGPFHRECQATGHCCEAGTPFFCPGDGSTEPVCCATPCNPLNGTCTPGGGCASIEDCEPCEVCANSICVPCEAVENVCCTDGVCHEACEVPLCVPEAGTCPSSQGLGCCEGLTCCEGEGVCRTECAPSCAPNCDCSIEANNGLGCNGGLAAGGGVCGCGFCVVPIGDCLCGCEGDTECVECEGGECVLINQGLSCNDGAGICDGEWCVDAPPVDCAAACQFRCHVIENGCDCGECPLTPIGGPQFCKSDGFCCPGTSLGTEDNCDYCGDVCDVGQTCVSNGSGFRCDPPI